MITQCKLTLPLMLDKLEANYMKYLVVNAPNFPLSNSSILIEPVDALTIATWIQHNHNDVSFIDLDRFGLDAINDLAANYKVALVVFDYLIALYSSEGVNHLGSLFSALAKRAEYILFVGRIATYFPYEVLDKFPEVYGCIIGEPEVVLADLFKYKDLRLLKNNPQIITRESKLDGSKLFSNNKGINIYDLFPKFGPIANRKLCQFDKYIDVHSIIASRGCSGRCKFCSTGGYLGNWKAASPELVLSEIKHLINLGTHKIIFLDDNFSNDQNRITKICEMIIQEKIDITWGCLCRIIDLNEDIIQQMHKAGCRWIHFGIEHDQQTRLKLGKNFSDEDAIRIIQFAQKIGVRIRTSWILDLLEATANSVKNTFELAKIISSYEIKLHFLALRPGSKYYDQVKFPKSIFNNNNVNEIFIHKGSPFNTSSKELELSIVNQFEKFKLEMCDIGYQWVPDARFWDKFNNREALPNEKFFSTSIMRYGLGWVR